MRCTFSSYRPLSLTQRDRGSSHDAFVLAWKAPWLFHSHPYRIEAIYVLVVDMMSEFLMVAHALILFESYSLLSGNGVDKMGVLWLYSLIYFNHAILWNVENPIYVSLGLIHSRDDVRDCLHFLQFIEADKIQIPIQGKTYQVLLTESHDPILGNLFVTWWRYTY